MLECLLSTCKALGSILGTFVFKLGVAAHSHNHSVRKAEVIRV